MSIDRVPQKLVVSYVHPVGVHIYLCECWQITAQPWQFLRENVRNQNHMLGYVGYTNGWLASPKPSETIRNMIHTPSCQDCVAIDEIIIFYPNHSDTPT